ncbi:unnamed protein product [Arctia plantaginis]|uniref:Uncharacterized protein n=1 Tax=Arctia plantaginis TaxID=874455 RepID=A0A8S0ZP83_ARCPL|nr:unnamed protein product [Arctia plantaginis]
MTVVVANPQFPIYPMFGQPPMMSMMPARPPMMPMMPGPPPMMPMMPGPPPMMPVPSPLMPAQPSIDSILPPSPPLNLQMQIGFAIVSDDEATSTTTEVATTTDKSKNDEIAIALPMPMPFPMPMPAPSPVLFAVPGMMSSVCQKNRKHPNCPPCPPCSCSPCTPSFFSYCSSCHQKCRCRNPKDVPLVPPPRAPFPLPGPAFPMPYPGHFPNSPFIPYPPFIGRPKSPKNEKSREENSECDSSEDYWKKKKKKKLNRKHNYSKYRRSNRRLDLDRSDNMIAEPVLNFMSSDGRVKLERRLSKSDVSLLMGDDSLQNFQITTVEPIKRVITYPYISKGKKKIMFRPPADMMIGNLSVSFNTK